ncbi:MAG: flagellar basal body protein FliL [Candidatus Puniceispirillum sp.]|nr:flagellar basal body protein FliL [Candidatus Pelagibacter sp.]MBA4282855.1 flagellar basal body protein FliL [Candidatus Puniceispirillum sp.]
MNKILVALSGIMFLMISSGVVVFFTPLKDHFFHQKNSEDIAEQPVNVLEISFLQLPEMIINLRQNAKGKSNILKATFILELISPKDKDVIEHLKPIISDQLQTYLRELKIEDLEGASGIEKVRHELKTRVSSVIIPVKIRNILFKEFLVQ